MKIITWNVNSIRQRMARALALLARHEPDVLVMQETKTTDETFPLLEFEGAGYHCAISGQAGLNGVAIVSREPPKDVVRGFPADPVPGQARMIAATIGEIRFVNCYVINGKTLGAPEYEAKLRWLDGLRAWLDAEHRPTESIVVAGDFNVTPADPDVHDPDLWRGENLASEPERERVRALVDWGLTDLMRLHEPGPGPFTWWDYRAGAFHKGWGLRIDLALGTASVASRCTGVVVDRDERKPTFGEGKPSDHAPVVVTLE